MSDTSPLLDWGDRRHWGGKPLPCRLCRKPALLRDDDGRPCHKICAEGRPNPVYAQPVAEPPAARTGETGGSPGIPCCGQRAPGKAGEPLILACQLCTHSPTYWRTTHKATAGPTATRCPLRSRKAKTSAAPSGGERKGS